MLNYGQDWGFARNGIINVLRRHISLRRRNVLWPWMTLVHLRIGMAQDEFLEKSVGKVNHLRTVMRFGLFPFFTFLASLECSYVILPQPCALLLIVCIPNRSMVICSIGHFGHFIPGKLPLVFFDDGSNGLLATTRNRMHLPAMTMSLPRFIYLFFTSNIIQIPSWLVVWNISIYFPIYWEWNVILPTDELIFFRGVGIPHYTTKQVAYVCIYSTPSNMDVVIQKSSIQSFEFASIICCKAWMWGFIPLSKWVGKKQLYTWNIPTNHRDY